MNSSYKSSVNFGDIITAITCSKKPKKIVECGILDGFSLLKFAESSNENTIIDAYDIFEKFNGNHAIKDKIISVFSSYNNVNINEGDFYEVFKKYSNNSIDIIHIDIANNGNVYEFVFNNIMEKLTNDGVIILEGGSEKRDNVEWMVKYNKPKIQPIIEKYKTKFNIKVIGEFPSITIVTYLN